MKSDFKEVNLCVPDLSENIMREEVNDGVWDQVFNDVIRAYDAGALDSIVAVTSGDVYENLNQGA